MAASGFRSRRALVLAWALVSGSIGGCGDPLGSAERGEPKPEFASLGGALTPALSEPFHVQGLPELDVETREDFEIACGAVRCLAGYAYTSAGVSYVLMSRIDPVTGEADNPRLQLVTGERFVTLGARDDEFLVVTSTGAEPDVAHHYYRVRGSDGAVLADDPTPRLPPGVPALVESTGSSWLFLYDDGAEAVMAVFDADLQPVGTPVSIPGFGSSFGYVAPGPGQYLVSSYGEAVRIDEATGALLDEEPIVWGEYAGLPNAQVAYHGGNYVFAWGSPTIVSIRVAAETGELLDPPDEFNQLPGYQEVYVTNASTEPDDSTRLAVMDGRLIAYWMTSSRTVRAIELDGATGLRPPADEANAPASLFTVSLPFSGEPWYDLQVSGEGAVVLDDHQYYRYGARQPGNTYVDLSDELVALNVSSFPALYPKVAANDEGFLVVWEQRASDTELAWIEATRIDPRTGAYLDDPPLRLGEGYDPVVASNGSDYLVNFGNGDSTLEFRMVHADGSSEDSNWTNIDWEVATDRHLLWNGSKFLLSWSDTFLRIEPDGTLIGAAESIGLPTLEMVSAADTVPEPGYRTAMLFGENPANALDPEVTGVRIRMETGSVVSPTTAIFTDHRFPLATSDGSRFLVVARPDSEYSYNGVLVDPVSGEPIEETRKPLLALNPYATVTQLLWDGRAFLVKVYQGGSGSYAEGSFVSRFDENLDPLDSEVPSPGFQVNVPGTMGDDAWAVGSDGRVLLAESAMDVDYLGRAVKFRFLDYGGLDDLTPVEDDDVADDDVAADDDVIADDDSAGDDDVLADDDDTSADDDVADDDVATDDDTGSDDDVAADDDTGSDDDVADDDSASADDGAADDGAADDDAADDDEGSADDRDSGLEQGDDSNDDPEGADGGIGLVPTTTPSGCGCRVGDQQKPRSSLFLMLALAGVWVARRRPV